MNAEEINENDPEEQEISESGYWDLSKLNEQSEADCTEAFAQFLDYIKVKKEMMPNNGISILHLHRF
ncbi:hypothetical protein [Anaerotignum sp.]|uniref:hypothetical protein n=1 Tax=Anaerotignum sp. TaxID=2039241 RepID=UPI0027B9DB42|nr:hypothetical protein [Anaerotignum sp.]